MDNYHVKFLKPEQRPLEGDNSERLPSVTECIISKSLYSGYGKSFLAQRCYDTPVDRHDHEDLIRCLLLKVALQCGVDVNAQSDLNQWFDFYPYVGLTAAMCAAKHGYTKCLRCLVECGADLDIESEDRETALTISVIEEHEECVKYLAETVTPPALNHQDILGRTALMLAVMSPGRKSFLSLQHLVAAGAELDLADEDGDTALTFAIFTKNMAALDLLLQSGSLVNTVSNHGETPLTFALQRCENQIAIKLLRFGADPTLSSRDWDCLHESMGVEPNSLVRALVLSGFPPLEWRLVNLDKFSLIKGPIGFLHQLKLTNYLRVTTLSPLALALLYNRPEIARYFIANQFFTRFDIVQLCWDSKIRKLLQEFEAVQSLQILDFLTQRPHSLFTLSLVAVSSAVSQDLVCEMSSVSLSQGDVNPWLFRPTFRERIKHLRLPPSLQRVLLHQTPSSSICCNSWDEIPLGGEKSFPSCSCEVCEGVHQSDRGKFIV
ncbi:hypothetical protein RRG08_022033 [Elysia crispata]|uniref:Ankyrin repeat protein n=1 Tax=Elysia crispata TaxID=231223 RepID=A0AAE1D6C3_9GAST|nr:hypothetical protein RRG08_022033 [Elysia crispata]